MEKSVIQYQMLTIKIMDIITLALLSAEKAVLFHIYNLQFKTQYLTLGGLAILRRATISFVMSVRLFAWNNSPATGRIFMKFGI
jgi:hypothetical protein